MTHLSNLFNRWPARSSYFPVTLLIFITSFLLLPTSKQVNNVYYLLLALPALIAVIRHPQLLKPQTKEEWSWLLFLITATTMGLLGGAPIQYFKHVGYVWLFCFAIIALADPNIFRHRFFGRFLFWSVCLYIIGSAVYYWVSGVYSVGARVLWLPSRMTGPIYTSIWLVACFALATPIWLKERRYIEFLSALFLSVACIGFILQSRSGFVGLLALPLFLVFTAQLRISAKNLLVILGLFLVLIFGVWSTDLLKPLLDRGDAARFAIWNAYLVRWWECGVLQGCGLELKEVYLTVEGSGILAVHPHNIFISIGSRLGMLSLLFFLGTVLGTLWQSRKRQDPWGLYLAVSLIMLNFDGNLIIGNPDEIWLLILLPMALLMNRSPPIKTDSDKA